MKLLYELDRCFIRNNILYSDEYVPNLSKDILLRNAHIFEDEDFIFIKALQKIAKYCGPDVCPDYFENEQTNISPFNNKSKIGSDFGIKFQFKIPFIKIKKLYTYSGYWIYNKPEEFYMKISKANIVFKGLYISKEIEGKDYEV